MGNINGNSQTDLPVPPDLGKVLPLKPKPGESGIYPPFAKVVSPAPVKGAYQSGWPSGAVVHFTAGRDGAEKTIKDGAAKGYAFWCIQRDGKLFCGHPANKWGYHAGESRWTGLVGGVSDDLIGIEINAAGRVTPQKNGLYKTWYGEYIGKEHVRYTPGVDNQLKGWYHVYTPEQEETLIKTILWLKEQNPKVFNLDLVLGHDEVSGPMGIGFWRKNDPGAALSMTMPEFRKKLKGIWGKS